MQSYFRYEKERQLQIIIVTRMGSSRIFTSLKEKKNPELMSPSIQGKSLERVW